MCPRLSLCFKTIKMHQRNIETSNTQFDVFSGSFSSLSKTQKAIMDMQDGSLSLSLSQKYQNRSIYVVCAFLALLWQEWSKRKEEVFISFLSLSLPLLSQKDQKRTRGCICVSDSLSISKSSKLRVQNAMWISGSSVAGLTKSSDELFDVFSAFLSLLSQKDQKQTWSIWCVPGFLSISKLSKAQPTCHVQTWRFCRGDDSKTTTKVLCVFCLSGLSVAQISNHHCKAFVGSLLFAPGTTKIYMGRRDVSSLSSSETTKTTDRTLEYLSSFSFHLKYVQKHTALTHVSVFPVPGLWNIQNVVNFATCGSFSLLSLSRQMIKIYAQPIDVVPRSASGIIQKTPLLTYVSDLSVPGIFEIRRSQRHGLSFSLLEIIKEQVVKPYVVSLFLPALGTLKIQKPGIMGSLSLLPCEISKHVYGQ